MTYSAVIFDLDGTLLDTIGDIADSMNAVLSRHGFPCFSVQEYRYLIGEGAETLIRRSLPPGRRSDEDIRLRLEEMREEYSSRWRRTTRPYEGVVELLSALGSRGVKTAVLSNKAERFTVEMARHFLDPHRFEVTMGAQAGYPRKPDPGAAREIAARFSLPPERVLFIGDTRTDMETAVRAGMYPLGALWGYRSAVELLASGAKGLAGTPSDVLRYFNPPGNP